MIKIIKFSFCFISLLIVTSCFKKEEARKPISEKRETTLTSSIERNTELVQNEEDSFTAYINKDKNNTYSHTKNGFWYTYLQRELKDSLKPQAGDNVTFTYEIRNLHDSLIYSAAEIGSINYIVDKEELLPILRHSIKLMKQNEKIKTLAPSALAYSYLGDKNKISKNQPLIFTIELKSIEKNN
ncbi:gliding motility-associated peptidyl-prolyl isomerase GldI [Myroides injenensis]|uniref:gliding motility-associated peptidyl-prolyl isomerase GldI n=1 Tax=Myroides injenensis TaxID=1183151 RepID=UPI0002DF6701|nr:gliding motility-associated peptidyl-prolyl isomerase GldI [Myroides injenensis]